MSLLQVVVLACVQGIAELLPVSSSAHVILAEKLMGLDPTTPEMTLLLVMLHTGTMFAVIVYFWREWKTTYFSTGEAFRRNAGLAALATMATGIVGLALLEIIPLTLGGNGASFEIEQLFGNAYVIAGGLAAAGVMILASGLLTRERAGRGAMTPASALAIGAVQGLCLPFRGFSRSGATISTGLLTGMAKLRAEEFSFMLAVILTPAVIVREAYRFFKTPAGMNASQALHLAAPSLFGMALSFVAGLIALRGLSRWLEHGRWHYFGLYCMLMSAVVLYANGRVLL